MLRNSKVKNQYDTEKAYESIINSSEFNFNTRNKITMSNNTGIIANQSTEENFDTFLEKRNRKSK